MKEQKPDQIRRDTTPAKHFALIYGLLGGMAGLVFWFGTWALFHPEQVRHYPSYCSAALRYNVSRYSLFGNRQQRRGTVLGTDALRYFLMRHGNLDHRYDAEIIRHGWYPKDAAVPVRWVRLNGALPPLYSDQPLLVFKWPTMLWILTVIGSAIWGLWSDHRYRCSIVSGRYLDGSILASVKEYNQETKGDGMRYRVKAWCDR